MILIYSTFPDLQSAKSAADSLLQERLIACANIQSPSQSMYWWEGKIESTTEITVWFKLPLENKTKTEQRLRELHPYDIPCIIALKPDSANLDYLEWLKGATKT